MQLPDLAGGDLTTCGPLDAGPLPDSPCAASGIGARAPTGRLSVQTRTAFGSLNMTVMDDNGCRRVVVATDHPVGIPRWAPDHERLAYVTGGGTLHVIRVARSGAVLCRAMWDLGGINATELAWAADHELWLGTPTGLLRWRIGAGQVDQVNGLAVQRFDAIADGPLVVTTAGQVPPGSDLLWRPQVAGGMLNLLYSSPSTIGPVRLSSDGKWAVYELSGVNLVQLDVAQPPEMSGMPGERSPAFALNDSAIVFTTDDGRLIFSSRDGKTDEVPPSWNAVYGPDWAPLPTPSCTPVTDCM